MRFALVVLTVALLLRLLAASWLAQHPERQLPDSELYRAYAGSLLQGEFAVGPDRAQRPPGYPLFWAACLAIGRSDQTVLVAQAILATLTVLVGWRFALDLERLQGLPAHTSKFALLFLAFDPYAIQMAGMLLSETLFTTLGLTALWLGLRGDAPQHRGTSAGMRMGLLAGLFAGAAVLTRPSALPLVPILLLPRLTHGEQPMRNAIACGVAFALVLMPWWIRNAVLYRAFVPTTLNVGESLYDGVGPQATGGSDMAFARDPVVRALPEWERDRHWRLASREAMLADPGRIAWLSVVKFARFWSPWPNAAEFRSPLVVAGTALATVPLWGLALYGIAAGGLPRWSLLLLLVPIAYFCGLHLLFVSSVRYRVPVGPLVAILAAAGASLVAHRRGAFS